MTISPLAAKAKKVIEAAWLHGAAYDLASQAAFALESAQLLQSPEMAAELGRLRAQVAALVAERHSTNEALSDAAVALRADRDRIAELEDLQRLVTVLEIPRPGRLPLQVRLAHGHDDRWMICDREGRRWHREHGWVFEAQGIRDEELRDATRFTLDEVVPLARQLADEPGGITRRIAPTQALQPVEDVPLRTRGLRELVAGQREAVDGEHYPHVHRDYRVSHDRPETGGDGRG